MTNKVDIKRLDSVTSNDTTATALINENFQNIQTALQNTLSRNGQAPNYMQNVLDMNSYRIINTAEPTDALDVVNTGYLDSFVGDISNKVLVVEEAAQAALEKANNAASSAASSAQYAQTAVNAAAAAAADAVTSAQAARDIEGYLEDPNLVAVGTDLRKGDDSLIKQAVEAATEILATDYAEDLSFSNNELQLLDQNGDALGNSVSFAVVASTGSYSDLSNKPTIPTVNNATISFTQGGVFKGSFTVNTSTDTTIALDAGGGSTLTAGDGIDITNNTISVTNPVLVNTATHASSLAVGGNVLLDAPYALAVGKDSMSNDVGAISVGHLAQSRNDYGIAIGEQAVVNGGDDAIAIGRQSLAAADNAIQIGIGTNAEASSLYIGTDNSHNWKLLDSSGKIPDARLSSNIQTTTNLVTSVSSSSTDSQYPSAKLFYDTCGDIETLINAL